MKLKKLKPHSMAYILSLMLGVLLLVIVVVAFLKFAHGNVWVALSMAFISTLMLSLFLGWVDVQPQEDESDENYGNKFMRKHHR
jgi:hypothetical protein